MISKWTENYIDKIERDMDAVKLEIISPILYNYNMESFEYSQPH